MDVAFVKVCMLKYLGRYVVKWRNFSEDLFSINRENNKDCVRVYGGFRSVWGKWKKQYKGQNLSHPEFIQAILENAKRIFEKEINSDLNGVGKMVQKGEDLPYTEDFIQTTGLEAHNRPFKKTLGSSIKTDIALAVQN